MSEAVERRRRGRPRKGERDGASTRAAIVKAASEEFAERGYEAASLRAVARRAGVDSALVHHYFDDKADLFATSLEAPLRPDRLVAAVLAGPRDDVGASIVRHLLLSLENSKAQARVVTIMRTALSSAAGSRMLKEFLSREIFSRLATASTAQDADLRANLAASQIVGLMMTRFVLKLDHIADASVDELAQRIGPVLNWHLYGDPGAPVAARSRVHLGEGLDDGGSLSE